MKGQPHNHTMVIYIQYKFHEIPGIGYLVMAEVGEKRLKFRQAKGYNSSISNDTPIKLHVLNHTFGSYIFSISFKKIHSLVIQLWLRTQKIIEMS